MAKLAFRLDASQLPSVHLDQQIPLPHAARTENVRNMPFCIALAHMCITQAGFNAKKNLG